MPQSSNSVPRSSNSVFISVSVEEEEFSRIGRSLAAIWGGVSCLLKRFVKKINLLPLN